MSFSVNPTGSVPPWNGEVNLRLAVAEMVSQATESVLADLTPTSEAALGQLAAPLPGASLPSLPAAPVAPPLVPASRNADRLALPEDWFEPSAPAKAVESALAAQLFEPQRPSSVERTALEALPLSSLVAEVAAGVVLTPSAPELYKANWPSVTLEDQHKKEIPLLIVPPTTPLPVQRVHLKAALVEGSLTLGVVLAAVLVASLTLEGLPSFKAMALGVLAAALVLAGVSILASGIKARRVTKDETPPRAR